MAISDEEIADYHPPSTWASDIQVLISMIFADVRGKSQRERLESFYKSQAHLYDSYRHRMLHGRFPMVKSMPVTKNGVWVDMGGGTGSNIEFYKNLRVWGKVVILDLCPSLVETAKRRVESKGHSDFVHVVLGDACDFSCEGLPAEGTADLVTFSYALTMIPDWRGALKNAHRMLKPGGHIAVCDFTIGSTQWYIMALFWTWLFANDHVHLKKEHTQVLKTAFTPTVFQEGYGQFPYVPFISCPYYYFVGKKTSALCNI